MPSRRSLVCALPYVVLLAEVVLFYRHILFFDYAIPWDLRGVHLPLAEIYADSISRGEFPLWDPYTYCGQPFQANVQSAALYPTVALAAWLGSVAGPGRLVYLLELNVVLHVLLAGIFAYRLGRAAGLSPPSALACGTVYQLGGFFAAHAEHMGGVMVAAWLPAAVCLTLKLSREWSLRNTVLLAAVLALSILGGLTPLTTVVFFTVLVFALLMMLLDGRNPRLPAGILVAFAASAVLAAAQLAPAIELTRHSIARERAAWLGTGGGVPLQALVSLVWPNYFGVFDPSTYRQPFELTFMYLYSGWLALALAAWAAIRRRAALNRVVLALLVIAAFAMLGDSTPVGRLVWSALPRSIRAGLHPEYATPAFLLSLALLAGLGLEQITARPKLRWAAAAICAVDLIAVSSGRPMHAMPLKAEPGISRTHFDGNAEILERARKVAHESYPPLRFDTIENTLPWAASAPTTQLPSANGVDPLALERLIRVRLAFVKGEIWGRYYEVDNLKSPVLSMLNVGYLVSRVRLTPERLAGSPFTFREDIPGFSIYENRSALPRFWLVPRVRRAGSEAEASAMIRFPGFNPAAEAVVEGDPRLPAGGETAGGTVRVLSYGLKDAEIEVDAPGWRFLASSEAHYPGWRAWLDGAEQPIFYTNVAFRGLPVPPGRHTVRFRFEPRLFFWAGWVSLAGWLGVLAVLARRRQPGKTIY